MRSFEITTQNSLYSAFYPYVTLNSYHTTSKKQSIDSIIMTSKHMKDKAMIEKHYVQNKRYISITSLPTQNRIPSGTTHPKTRQQSQLGYVETLGQHWFFGTPPYIDIFDLKPFSARMKKCWSYRNFLRLYPVWQHPKYRIIGQVWEQTSDILPWKLMGGQFASQNMNFHTCSNYTSHKALWTKNAWECQNFPTTQTLRHECQFP